MQSKQASLLMVDDDPSAIQILSKMLADFPEQRFATSGEVALRLAKEAPPDLILLDVEMPGMTGFDVREAMKHDPILSNVPVIFVTSYDAKDLLQAPRSQSGPAVFINKPLNSAQLTSAVRRQLRPRQAPAVVQQPTAAPEPVRPAALPARLTDRAPPPSRMADERRRGATLLALTSVADRRGFDEAFDREWERCRQGGLPLAALLVEIDQLKEMDEAGRVSEADSLLTYVAQTLLAASLRPEDLIARQADAQFLMLLPEMTSHSARQLAEGVLHRVARRPAAGGSAPPSGPVTVSIGIGTCDKENACWHALAPASTASDDVRTGGRSRALVRAAAGALIAAIQAGRNQVRALEAGTMDPAATEASTTQAVMAEAPPREAAMAEAARTDVASTGLPEAARHRAGEI